VIESVGQDTKGITEDELWNRPERRFFRLVTHRKSQRISASNHDQSRSGSFRMSFIHLSSPMFLYSVYVLLAFPLGKYRVINGSADPKGKLQLPVF
jgi:hypothetical protein